MKKSKLTRQVILAVFPLAMLVATNLSAQSGDTLDSTTSLAAKLALRDGDRVLMVGNSLFENDLLYGYLELALTTRWPERSLTFRNISWTGDTVFGEARSYITSPPTPFELLLKQIRDANPTVVLVAYGGIEAYAGAEGIPGFAEGLGNLIDTISSLGARTILLSPIPLFSTNSPEFSGGRNEMLGQYTNSIARMAADRDVTYLDIFNPLLELGKKVRVSDNGVHLNETGYYQLANLLEEQLGAPSREEFVSIDLSPKGVATSQIAKIIPSVRGDAVLKFGITSDCLPLPVPALAPSQPVYARHLNIKGLKKGYYALSADGLQIISASAERWAEGVDILQGPDFAEAERLKAMIIEKNKVYFQQYRPHNRTYIIGFRAYEQGRHAEGLKDLGLIVKWLEGQIALHRSPVSPMYTLIKLR